MVEPKPLKPIPHGVKPVEDLSEPIPEAYAKEKAVGIVLEELGPIGERVAMRATLRIINPTDQAVWFSGYSVRSPVTKQESLVNGKWLDDPRAGHFCKYGLAIRCVAPGRSAVFTVPAHPDAMPARIGISYNHGKGFPQEVVWSPKIEK